MCWFCCRKKVVGEDKVINCPRCKIPLVKKTREGVTIDKCKRCGGIWLDKGEIENILMRVEEESRKAQKKRGG